MLSHIVRALGQLSKSSTNRTYEILHHMDASSFEFNLTGSCRESNGGEGLQPNDIDFFVEDTEEVRIALKDMGFAEDKCYLSRIPIEDKCVSDVLVHMTANIHVQLIRSEWMDWKISMSKLFDRMASTPMTKRTRAALWCNMELHEFEKRKGDG